MSLHTRLAALERRRPAGDDALAGMADTVLDTLAEAGEPLPDRAAVLADLRAEVHFSHGSHVFKRAGAELLIREYVGVDLDAMTGRTKA